MIKLIVIHQIFIRIVVVLTALIMAYSTPVLGQVVETIGYISGTVLSNGEPLSGAQVWVSTTHYGDVTDEKGLFKLRPFEEGKYTLIVSYIGYETKTLFPVFVLANEPVNLTIELKKSIIQMSSIMVTPKEEKFDPEGVTAHLSTRMIKEAPGSAQDIFLVLQTLPGVASGGDDSKLYVRGGRADENLVIYDGMVIRNPFHFDIVGGGFYTVFNSSMVENVDFYSGGFPARYGDRLSAVMVINNREGNQENVRGEFSLSMSDIKWLVDLPLSESVTTIFSARRSYFDFLLGGTGFGTEYDLIPFFYDINSKTDIVINNHNRLSLNILYSKEKMSGEFDEPHWVGTHKWSSENWTVGVRLRSLISQSLSSDLNVYWSNVSSIANHADGAGIEDIQGSEIAIKEDITFIKKNHELHAGFWFVEDRSDVKINLPIELAYNFEPADLTAKGSALKLSAYLDDTWEVFPWVSLNYGLRSDYVISSSEFVLSPRMILVVSPTEKLQLTANYGLYSQSPPAYELENNSTLKSRKSEASGVGLNIQLFENISGSFEIYKKNFFNLMSIDSKGNFQNEGYGNVLGYEVYLQKRSGDTFIGWLSYTYSVAKRKEGITNELELFNYDRTHMFTGVVQVRPNDKWKLGLKFRYATGVPYTPAKGGVYNTLTDQYFPIVGERNSVRYEPYHRLDVRLARSFPTVLKGLVVYIETINTYNRQNVAYFIWNDDFSATKNFSIFPFLPILGVDLYYD